ncbi:MAG: hypothetical protein C9356_09545 [Oleiphilus sp.]|nr:MAG: hypothetical protein C9356_09545 [Oleiphilus sp.]
MQITNQLLTERLSTTINSPAQAERQSRPERQSRVDSPERRSANASVEIDQQQLESRGQALQASRVERLNDIESAPLKTQQALNTYQQTELASEQFEFGELVGVDLFA